MDILLIFGKGLFLGVAVAAPVGPVGILVLRRSLEGGRALGLASGLGAAVADSCYGLIAALGLTWLSEMLVANRFYLSLFGGGYICLMGARMILKGGSMRTGRAPDPDQPAPAIEKRGLWGAWASTFIITLTNPMTILFFAAVFAGLGTVTKGQSYLPSLVLVLGVFLGSAAWWVFLSALAGRLRGIIMSKGKGWVGLIAGATLVVMGLVIIWNSLAEG